VHEDWKKCVLRCFLKVHEVAERTTSGRLFRTRAAAIPNAEVQSRVPVYVPLSADATKSRPDEHRSNNDDYRFFFETFLLYTGRKL